MFWKITGIQVKYELYPQEEENKRVRSQLTTISRIYRLMIKDKGE